jgi:hypothetical protein
MQRCHEIVEQTVGHFKSSSVVQNIVANPKFAVYGAGLLFLASWVLVQATQYLKRSPERSRPLTPDLEKPAARSFKAAPRKPGGLLQYMRN